MALLLPTARSMFASCLPRHYFDDGFHARHVAADALRYARVATPPARFTMLPFRRYAAVAYFDYAMPRPPCQIMMLLPLILPRLRYAMPLFFADLRAPLRVCRCCRRVLMPLIVICRHAAALLLPLMPRRAIRVYFTIRHISRYAGEYIRITDISPRHVIRCRRHFAS